VKKEQASLLPVVQVPVSIMTLEYDGEEYAGQVGWVVVPGTPDEAKVAQAVFMSTPSWISAAVAE